MDLLRCWIVRHYHIFALPRLLTPNCYRGACGQSNVASDFIVALNTPVSTLSVSEPIFWSDPDRLAIW